MVDLVLINPNNRILSEYAAIEPPLWAGLIASHYKWLGDNVAIVDAEAPDLSVEETAHVALSYKPKQVMLVVMGNNPSVSSTPKMGVAKRISDILKTEAPLSITGLHPSALPIETEKEFGISVKQGKIFDGLPKVAWGLLPMDKYRAHNWHCLDGSARSPYASIYTSLGCPMRCDFCNIHALYGGQRTIQYRGSTGVADELGLLIDKYGVKNVKFWDELFTFNKTHVTMICDEIIKRGYKLNIWAYARVDSVNPHLLEKMKKAGINWLAYGFEAGTEKALSGIHKGASRQEAFDVAKMTHDAGINIMGNFIFGLPGENEQDWKDTLMFAKTLEIEYVNFYEMKPYPGSALYDKSMEGNWTNFDQYQPSKTEAGKFRDKVFNEFFTDTEYLRRIRLKFGQQAVTSIRDMIAKGKPMSKGVG